MKRSCLVILLLLCGIAAHPSYAQSQEPQFFFYLMEPDGETEGSVDEFKHNFEAGIALYNEGVQMLMNLQAESDDDELVGVQAMIQGKFREALPYFETCYRINPKHAETVTALSGIAFAQGDLQRYQRFQEELEAIVKN